MPAQEAAWVFQITIRKFGPEDKLGMDVKHLQGKLEVVHLFRDGAIERNNTEQRAKNPPAVTLEVGDIIHRVNNVDNNDHQMVAECRLRDTLVMLVSRRKGAAVIA